MKRNLMIGGGVALAAVLAIAVVFAAASGTGSEDGPPPPSSVGDPTPPPTVSAVNTQTPRSSRLTSNQIARAKSIFENDGHSSAIFEGHPYTISSIYPTIEGDTGTLTGAAIDVHLNKIEVVSGTFLTRDYLGEGEYKLDARQLTVEGVETFVVYVDLREGAVVQITPEGHRNFTITENR